MVDPQTTISFAQYKEDLVLLALFSDVRNGFYIDVGASFPEDDSVTKLFYDKGWHGVNIEPIKTAYQMLVKARPKDININCGLGAEKGVATFREFTDLPGHSTFNPHQKKEHGRLKKFKDYEVEIKTLDDIFKENRIEHVHFLKIDVEGFEDQVINGNNWIKNRPEVICIEANHIQTEWQKTLLDQNYKLFMYDGLNDYYVAKEYWARTKDFAEKIIKIDHYSLRKYQHEAWTNDLKELQRYKDLLSSAQTQMHSQEQFINELQELATLSLKKDTFIQAYKESCVWLNC